jgi:general secretion pathway protein H
MIRTRDPQAGMTLIEVLVFLAIMGVTAGVVTLGMGTLDRGSRAEAEARRLADRLQLAGDETLVSSDVLALVWDEEGYRFDRWDSEAGTWRASSQRLLGPRHTLARGLHLVAGDGGPGTPPLVIAADLAPEAATFVVAGSASSWIVGFDGFVATATPLQTAEMQARDG